MTRIAGYFLRGLLVVVPVGLTVWFLIKAFQVLDGLVPLPIPGLGFIVLVLGVTLVGLSATNFLTARLLGLLDGVLQRLPFVKLLYTSLKDLLSAFVGEKKRFDKPVVVDLAAGGLVRAFGFITRESMDEYGIADCVAVYFPQAYNFAGQVVIVPRQAVTPLARDSAAVMAFIVSGGVTGHPPKHSTPPLGPPPAAVAGEPRPTQV